MIDNKPDTPGKMSNSFISTTSTLRVDQNTKIWPLGKAFENKLYLHHQITYYT